MNQAVSVLARCLFMMIAWHMQSRWVICSVSSNIMFSTVIMWRKRNPSTSYEHCQSGKRLSSELVPFMWFLFKLRICFKIWFPFLMPFVSLLLRNSTQTEEMTSQVAQALEFKSSKVNVLTLVTTESILFALALIFSKSWILPLRLSP